MPSCVTNSSDDKSGTSAAELRFWKDAGIDPKSWGGYKEAGSGMGPTLNMSAAMGAHKEAGMKFIEWITSPEGQAVIADYKINGEQLFFPGAKP